MGLPGILPGGFTNANIVDVDINALQARASKTPSGVFAPFPGATPKYALNKGPRDAEYSETMARMFIQMPTQEREHFVNSVPPESRELAQVLCGVGEGATGGTGFIDFLLQNVSENFQEKFQVVETLSDNFIVYTFGQAAPTFTYSGTVLNTYQDDQRVWMLRLYRDILRGTQLARRRKLVRLRYDSVIVSGIMVGMGQNLDSTITNAGNFQFNLIPMQYTIFTPPVGVPMKLTSSFTEGGKYSLQSTQPPATGQLRVSSASAPVEAAAKPSAQVSADSIITPKEDETKAEKINRRIQKVTSQGLKIAGQVYKAQLPLPVQGVIALFD